MKLFVANFDEDMTEEDLEEIFRDYGKVNSVKIWIDFDSGKSKGFGFVEMPDDYEAETAIDRLDGTRWRGRRLKVAKARS